METGRDGIRRGGPPLLWWHTVLLAAGMIALVGAPIAGWLGPGWGRGAVRAADPGPGAEVDELVRARVVQVIDGDTFVVAFAGAPAARVRLLGVDAPESVHPTRGVEPYGLSAAAFLSELLPPETLLRLEFDVEVADQNGRLLVYAYLPDGRMVNQVLLEAGYAQMYTFPPNVRYVERFRAAQREGREQRRGLWAIPPDDGEDGTTPGPRLLVAAVDLEAEWVEVWNGTDAAVELTGWKLVSVRGGQEYEFPQGFILTPGAAVAVTSGSAFEHRPPLSLGWTRQNVWANGGDPAELLDPEGRLVAAFP